jgi:serine phosphatase RsbU (regulator of sigma subunit)
MEEQRSWRGTLRNTAKDFESYWIDSCICPVLDNEGKTIKYWSLSYDISDQIKVQQELEDKNNELMDSMRYAKRIQKTILPDKKTMDKTLDDHFTIYKPKDIVSGDFYWTTSTIDKVFIAAVDCTGHGVPGAFMSLIGYNLLNQIVIQRRIHTPGLILTELHKGVRATLKQDSSDSKSRDGMDITLVAIDRFDDRIQFAGAYNPLYWHDQKELHIIKGDKMAIGGEQMEDERVFTNHEIEIKPGDCIYLTTDGFVDQFGGPEGKKFGTKRLKELIEENWHEKMTVQRALFNLKWKDWIMDGEQIDDVTIIGIKFTDEEEGEK